MKISTNLIAGVGLLAAAGLVAPAFAATQPNGAAPNASSAMPATGTGTSSRMNPSQPGMNGQNGQNAMNDQNGMNGQGGSVQLSQQTIRQLQQALDQNGEKVRPDGVWGPNTEAALKQYQQKNGLPVTGQLDQATRSKLNLQT